MHIVRLNAPYIEGEGNSRDYDFTREGIRVRWSAGYDDTKRVLAERPWEKAVDPMEGVAVYDSKPAHLTFSAAHTAT
jgi:NTE family protein